MDPILLANLLAKGWQLAIYIIEKMHNFPQMMLVSADDGARPTLLASLSDKRKNISKEVVVVVRHHHCHRVRRHIVAAMV